MSDKVFCWPHACGAVLVVQCISSVVFVCLSHVVICVICVRVSTLVYVNQ